MNTKLNLAGSLQQQAASLRQNRAQLDAQVKENVNLERSTSTQLMKIRENKRKVSLVRPANFPHT